MNDIVQIFKALSDETRLRILVILSRRRICAKGISKHLDISEAAVSQHVKVLKECGIIKGEKVGYYVHYDLQKNILSKIIECIQELNGEKDLKLCKTKLSIHHGCKAKCKSNKCCEK